MVKQEALEYKWHDFMNNSKFCCECGLELDWSDIV